MLRARAVGVNQSTDTEQHFHVRWLEQLVMLTLHQHSKRLSVHRWKLTLRTLPDCLLPLLYVAACLRYGLLDSLVFRLLTIPQRTED